MGCTPSNAINDVSDEVTNVSKEVSNVSNEIPNVSKEATSISNQIKNFKIHISYCWTDRKIGHQLNKDLKILGSILEIDLDKKTLNLENSIPDCDLFIVCLSESYMNCFACQREANLASNYNIPMFMVSANEKFKLDLNKAAIIFRTEFDIMRKEKIFFYLESTTEILIKIKNLRNQIIKEQEKTYEKKKFTQSEILKIKSEHEEKRKKIIKREEQESKITKENIEKLFIYDEFISGLMKEVPIIYRWYMKYPNVTISNLAPFSASGDANDAAFPYPSDSLKSYKFRTQNKLYGGRKNQKVNKKIRINLCKLSTEYDKILAQKKPYKPDYAHELFAKQIERGYRFDTSLTCDYFSRSLVGFSGPDRTEEEMKQRKKLDTDLSLRKKRRLQLSKYFNDCYKDCNSDTFCNFAQRLLKNNQEFQAFCAKDPKSNSESKNEIIVDCPICFKNLDEIKHSDEHLVSSQCGHLMCNCCFEKFFENKSAINCPFCGSEQSKSNYHKIFI